MQEPSQDQMQPLINLYTQGQYQKALTETEQLLLEFPNSASLYNFIGAVHKKVGKLEDAVAAYETAIFMNPNIAGLYNNIGLTRHAQGQVY